MLLKKWNIRSNHKRFNNNEICKAIMTRNMLGNRFLPNRSEENRKLFYKQRNQYVLLLQNSKKDHLANLNEKNITYNKRFWKTVKPFLWRKIHFSQRINLTEEESNSLLTNCEEVAKELNNFLANAVKNLNIPNYKIVIICQKAFMILL